MNMQEEAVKKITNELWNDNLWFRQLDEEGQKTIATTVAMIRMNRIKGMRKFAEVMNAELNAILANPGSFGLTERQEVPDEKFDPAKKALDGMLSAKTLRDLNQVAKNTNNAVRLAKVIQVVDRFESDTKYFARDAVKEISKIVKGEVPHA